MARDDAGWPALSDFSEPRGKAERERCLKVAFLSQPRDAVTPGGPQHGSVAVVLDALASRLAQTLAVTVIAPQARGQPLAETITPRLDVRRVPGLWRNTQRALEIARGLIPKMPLHSASRLYFPGYPAQAARLLQSEPPDIVHVMSYPQFAPALRRRLPTAGLVLHLHDEVHLRLPPALAGRCLARFDAVVTCSAWLERGLRRRFPHLAERIHHVGNGVDLDAFSPPASAPSADRGPNLLFVGRISPEKGVHILAAALDYLRARHAGLTLELVGAPGLLPYAIMRLIGHGPAAEALTFYGSGLLAQLRAQILGNSSGYLQTLQGRLTPAARAALRVRGPLPHDRLVEVYRAADVFVLPSLCEEPFGIPLVEAMACGLPVVATRSGGVPDIVEHGVSGLLVERGDVAKLVTAVATLLDAPDLRAAMGAAARARAERLFGWNRAAQRLLRVYDKVLSSRTH